MLTIGRSFSYSLKIQKNVQDISWLILISEIDLLKVLISSQKVNFLSNHFTSECLSIYLSLTEFLKTDFRTLYLSPQWSDSDDIWHTSQPEDVADDTNVRTAVNSYYSFRNRRNTMLEALYQKTCLLENSGNSLKHCCS